MSAGIWRPPLHFSLLLGTVLIGSVHELLLRQALAFSSGSTGAFRYLGSSLGFSALLAGAALARWLRLTSRVWLAPLLTLDSVLVSGSSTLLFATFGHAYWNWLSSMIFIACGLPLGATLVVSHAALGKLWRQLSLGSRLLNPLFLGAFFGMLVLAASVPPLLGFLRSAYLAGLLLALLALWYRQLYGYLERRALPWSPQLRLGARLAGAASAIAFAASEGWVSRQQLGYFQHPLVLSTKTAHSEVVVTTGPLGLQLFLNRSLRAADIDSHRYFEALVHPAFAAHGRVRTVLILGTGDGFVEREVLAYDSVERIDVVTEDLLLLSLARENRWLRARTNSAMGSPKLHVVQAEPLVWLQGNRPLYDLILVDLPDPTEPRWGKYFTRYFYTTIAKQLAPQGIAAMQAGASFDTPRTFANISATVRSAQLLVLPYSVPLPSIGDWGFVLASNDELSVPTELNVSTRFLSSSTLASLFLVPPDGLKASGGDRMQQDIPSTLYDQRVVRLFNEEHQGAY